jgi:hypothetical protein
MFKGVRGWADETPSFSRIALVHVLLRGLTRALLPPLPSLVITHNFAPSARRIGIGAFCRGGPPCPPTLSDEARGWIRGSAPTKYRNSWSPRRPCRVVGNDKLPSGEGWGEGECQVPFVSSNHDPRNRPRFAGGNWSRLTFALTPALSRGERGKYVDLRNFFENPEACTGNGATKPERTRLVKSGAFHQPSARLLPSRIDRQAFGSAGASHSQNRALSLYMRFPCCACRPGGPHHKCSCKKRIA